MAKKASIDEMAKVISKELSAWSQDVTDAVKAAATETAKETVKELRVTSPQRTGGYAKSWTHKKTEEDRFGINEVVYNRKYYRLTHLLEYGHANARGGGRTPAYPHIGQAEDNAIRMFEEKTRRNIDDIN